MSEETLIRVKKLDAWPDGNDNCYCSMSVEKVDGNTELHIEFVDWKLARRTIIEKLDAYGLGADGAYGLRESAADEVNAELGDLAKQLLNTRNLLLNVVEGIGDMKYTALIQNEETA